MINLLPYDKKSDIAAARANTLLIKYIFIVVASGIFVFLATYVAYSINRSTIDNLEKSNSNSIVSINGNELKVAEQYKNEMEYYRLNVLSNSYNYSDILTKLASKLPSGVIIEEISLSSGTTNSENTVMLYGVSSQILNTLKETFSQLVVNETPMPAAKFGKYTHSATLKINLARDLK